MKKHFLFLLLWLGMMLIINGCGTAVKTTPVDTDTTLSKGPYLIYTNNNTSMTVTWQTNRTPSSSSCTMQWGPTTNYGQQATVFENSSAENMHQFFYTITGLNPAQRIYYKVTAGSVSYQSSFVTAPNSSATATTFYAFSDSQSFFYDPPEPFNSIAAAILRDSLSGNRQTFVAGAGDFAFFGMDEDSWMNDYFNRNYPELAKFQSLFPMLGAIGNHETYHYSNLNYIIDSPNAGKLLRKYWPYSFLPDANRSYYSFDYGPIHFCVLDQYTLLDGVSGHTFSWEAENNTGQFAWMKQDLQNTTRPWKIVMFHEPAWTAQKAIGFYGNNQVMRDYYCPVFKQEGVKVAVQGHLHYYSRCATEEIQYLTLGGGGSKLFDLIETDAPAFVTGESGVYHFARFDVVDNHTMQVSVINKDNEVLDSFTVNQ